MQAPVFRPGVKKAIDKNKTVMSTAETNLVKRIYTLAVVLILGGGSPLAAFPQEKEALPQESQELPEEEEGLPEEEGSGFQVNMDLVSSYIWRGVRQGNGPAFQPSVEFTTGGFTLGAWGSYYFADPNHTEADLYATFTLGSFTLGLMDYYYSGTEWWNTANHAYELYGGLAPGRWELSVNAILNDGAGAYGGDLYFEAGYTAGRVTLFAGAGTGWHTPDGEFNLCNLGLSTTREIKITDHFSLPLTGSVILNPAEERLFVVAAISL